MHALASIMVLLLANHLFAKLEINTKHGRSSSRLEAAGATAGENGHANGLHTGSKPKKVSPPPPAPQQQPRDAKAKQQKSASSPAAAAAAGDGGDGEQSYVQQMLMLDMQPLPWIMGSSKAQAQALLCALLFALHPIHVEVS
jgi:hypothetical protein